MEPVSQAWKNNQRQTLTSESFVEISIRIGNPDAQADAVVSTNGAEFFSNPQEVAEETAGSPVPYAALEPGIWVLDGTRRILGGPWEPVTPPEDDSNIFIPMGETTALLTADGQDFCVSG